MLFVGVLIGLLVIAQLLVTLWASVRHAMGSRQQRRLATELLRQRIATAIARRTVHDHDRFSWNGYRKFEVSRRIEEARDQCSFYLVPTDGKPLPLYQPGQYLTFRIPLAGRDKPLVRCYSLSGVPGPDQFRVTIKRVPAPEGKSDVPAGTISNWFHDQAQVGTELDVRAPRGDFQIEPMDSNPIVLIGAGIGITPLFSMAASVLARNPDREMWLFYGVRHGGDHVFQDEMRRLRDVSPRFRLRVCYSAPRTSDVSAQHFDVTGRISTSLLRRELPSNNYDFYICGPPSMMSQLPDELEHWGVPASRIFCEAFGSASARSRIPTPSTPGPSVTNFKVAFRRSKCEFVWKEKYDTILGLAEANGVRIDSGCRAGNCGTCEIALLSGNVDCRQAGAEVADGSCLACIAAPLGNVVLDA